MLGFFPAALSGRALNSPEPLIARVGGLLVKFTRPLDYYAAEGRNAYGRAAETARLFDPDARETFTRLAEGFEGYQGLMEEVKRILSDSPQVRAIESALPDSGGDED